MGTILHLLSEREWAEAQRAGAYRPASLESEGFIHCSTTEQLVDTANLIFRGQTDLVVLCIEEERVAADVRYEAPAAGVQYDDRIGASFPHLYGPLDLDAITQVLDMPCRPDGSFELPAALAGDRPDGQGDAGSLSEFRERQRRLWADGDYRPVGRLLEPVALSLVERAGVTPGQRVLDVATGSGTVAVAAARAGATVTGVDLTDAWFDEAQRRAADHGVQVDLRVGDAEDLPGEDGAFDVVLSSFGVIFAPRPEVAVAELVRVCRPGGRIGFTSWTPDGANARVFSALYRHVPPARSFSPPVDWSDPDHVRTLFGRYGVDDLAFDRPALPVEFPSTEAYESFIFGTSGPAIAARQSLVAIGRWDVAITDVRAVIDATNEAADGTYRATWRYGVVLATAPDIG